MATTRGFTDAWIKRIKSPAKGQKDNFDPAYPGLAFRASHKGARSWEP